MKTFITWFAGFFEDQKGSASSKRAALYVCLLFLGKIVYASLNGKAVNSDVLFWVCILICVGLGMVTTEMVASFIGGSRKKDTGDPPDPPVGD